MADKAWKAMERRVAKFFGTQRTALSGGNSKLTRSDSLHPLLFVEAKLHKKFAHHSLFQETAQLANKEEKIPILATQVSRAKTFLVTVDKDDLVSFCKVFLRQKGYVISKSKQEG